MTRQNMQSSTSPPPAAVAERPLSVCVCSSIKVAQESVTPASNEGQTMNALVLSHYKGFDRHAGPTQLASQLLRLLLGPLLAHADAIENCVTPLKTLDRP